MLFSSYAFVLLFLPCVLLGFYGLSAWRGASAARLWLVVSSLGFFSWWNPVYVLLLLGSILFNFYCAQGMQKQFCHRPLLKKRLLQCGIMGNVIFLGYFKYANFFIANVNMVAATDFPLLNIMLPLAISFFTLQQIAFLVDVYEGMTEEKSFFNYMWFVVFFPQLIAGPIVTHRDAMPQFCRQDFGRFNDRQFAYGLFVFSIGLFKKVVIADSIAPLADAGFANVNALGMLDAWYATTAYTLQAYFDFSGYSDMAVGLGLLFGIALPINFKSPYKATSIIAFWQRWHISLTDFINAYLYMPLMRMKNTFSFNYSLLVTLIVMSIVGLWHGASWTFVGWGVLHGVALGINHLWRRTEIKMPAWCGWALTILWWHLTLVMFRSESFADALAMYQALLGDMKPLSKFLYDAMPAWKVLPIDVFSIFVAVVFVVLIAACAVLKNPHDHRDLFKPSFRYLLVTVVSLVGSLLLMGHVAEFIYFQF
jgi:alginate O-acetyltransferase complex protein AlgI